MSSSTDSLCELMTRDFDVAGESLLGQPNANARLRPYQPQANTAAEHAIARRQAEISPSEAISCDACRAASGTPANPQDS
jgi:hypothetical protein